MEGEIASSHELKEKENENVLTDERRELEDKVYNKVPNKGLFLLKIKDVELQDLEGGLANPNLDKINIEDLRSLSLRSLIIGILTGVLVAAMNVNFGILFNLF
jgi:hypothetical protein